MADNCNYRCVECPISDSNSTRTISNLSVQQAQSIILSSAQLGAKALKLNYINEPLLYPDKLFELASYALSVGILDVYMTTNGSLLTKDISKRLINSRTFSRIQVSIDAFTSPTYSKIRVGGSLDRVTDNVMNFLRLRHELNSQWPKIRVSFLTLPENKHEIDQFYDFWFDKVDAIALQSSVLKPNSERLDKTHFSDLRSAFCPNPFRQMVVRANGDVLPCCSFWGDSLKLGNILESDVSLGELFLSKDMMELQDSFSNPDKNISDTCRNCLSSCDPS